MAKMKTHKATAKRLSYTATGKLKMYHSGHRHKLGLKDSKRKRHLRQSAYVSETRLHDIKRLLPYA